MRRDAPSATDAGEEAGARTSRADTNLATERVLRVLSQFASEAGSLGVTEIAERLGMSKNMVFRALTTLVDQGYLVRTPDGRRYELGYRIIELCGSLASEPDLRTLAWPYVRRMQQASGETVVLSLRVRDGIVVIDGIEPPNQNVRTRAPVGSRFPLHASPSSRVVLAHLSDPEIDQFLASAPLTKFTPTTLTKPAELRRDIATVRARGYALGVGDATPGRSSVAFAILDAESVPWGAIVVGGPDERFTRERIEAVLPELGRIAAELNARTRLFVAPPQPALLA